MNRCRRLLIVAALFAPSLAIGAPAPQQTPESVPGPRYMMTHFEVAPEAVPMSLTAMKAYRAAALKETGATSVDIFQESGHPSRFIISEVWRDHQAFETHAKSPAVTDLANKLKPIEFRPPDMHPHFLLAGTPFKAPAQGHVYVISHVDACCGGMPVLLDSMKSLAAAAAKESGMVRYEVLDQLPPRANHARLYEEWASEKDWVAHNLSQPVRDTFSKLQEYLGTPYDQRLYRLAN